MIHWEVAHQPGVWIILIGGENFMDNRYIKHISLGSRPYPLQQSSEKKNLKSNDHPWCNSEYVILEVFYLMCLMNDDRFIRECLNHLKAFNSCCKKKRNKKVSIFAYFEMKLRNGNLLRFLFLKLHSHSHNIRLEDQKGKMMHWSEHTLPVVPKSCVPKVVADLMTCDPSDSMSSFERIQNEAVLLHLSPVHLQKQLF